MEPVGNSAEQFRAVISSDNGRWRPLIQKLDLKLD